LYSALLQWTVLFSRKVERLAYKKLAFDLLAMLRFAADIAVM